MTRSCIRGSASATSNAADGDRKPNLGGRRIPRCQGIPPTPWGNAHMARLVRLGLALALIAVLAVASTASAAAGGRKLLDSTMTGLPTGSLVLDGVTGGGVPWSITDGHVQLFADGRLHVDVEGLIITATGTNP